jgi:hypothetical protein
MSFKPSNRRQRLRRRRAKNRATARPKPLPTAAIGIISALLAQPPSKVGWSQALAEQS